ncbi:MAG: alpha-L-fucosidase, partial [Anaerolineales bacterium]
MSIQSPVQPAPYQPTWSSLRAHHTARWFQEAKFGVYTHWGVYSVPAYRHPTAGQDVTWYGRNMYFKGTPQHAHHLQTYGDPSQFGYKDFIPLFTGEKFDPDEWAELYQQSGARYAGTVGEHHDGFCMWDTRLSDWSAAKLGPRRDVVGELEQAIRRQGLKFLVALHHAENWWFYPHAPQQSDTADPRYAGLYGETRPHAGQNIGPELFDPATSSSVERDAWLFEQARPSAKFLERWLNKITELIDRYGPDMLWFDFGIRAVPDYYKQQFLAYYYNQSALHGRDVAVTFKKFDLAPGGGVVDLEAGRMPALTYHAWNTDTSVDDSRAWGYYRDARYKSTASLVHYLVDNVSKNGHLLLNIGPRPNGTLPEPAVEVLRGMGRWLAVNGEAIYGTTSWYLHGEGPTGFQTGVSGNEKDVAGFTARDIRFTTRDNALYAICLGWPGAQVTIATLKALYPSEIEAITMLGSEQRLK